MHSSGNYFICPSHVEGDTSEERKYRAVVEALARVTGFDRQLHTVKPPGSLVDYGKNDGMRLIVEMGTQDQPNSEELRRLLEIIPRMSIGFIDRILGTTGDRRTPIEVNKHGF